MSIASATALASIVLVATQNGARMPIGVTKEEIAKVREIMLGELKV